MITIFYRNDLLYRSWEEFDFGGSPAQYFNKNSRLALAELKVYIKESSFTLLFPENSNGGAISYNAGESAQMLIELSSFISCVCSNTGGAIHLNNGEVACNKCCFCGCYSTTDIYAGQCISFVVKDSLEKKNYLIDSSIIHSMRSFFFESHSAIINMRYGDIKLNKINVSNNKCKYNMIYVEPSYSINEIKTSCNLIYCSIEKNEATMFRIVLFGSTESKSEIKYSNIIDNQNKNESNAMIQTSGHLNVYNCFIFDFRSILLFKGEILLDNCSIITRLKENEIAQGYVIFGSTNYNFVNEIEFTSDEKGYCKASIDKIQNFMPRKKLTCERKYPCLNNLILNLFIVLTINSDKL